MKQFVQTYILSLLTAAFILYISVIHISSNPLPQVKSLDKIVHILMYLGLTTTMGIEYLRGQSHSKPTRLKLLLPWMIAVVYGGVIELLQAYCTTNRSGDWYDWMGNTLGATLSLIGLWLISDRIPPKSKHTTPQ